MNVHPPVILTMLSVAHTFQVLPEDSSASRSEGYRTFGSGPPWQPQTPPGSHWPFIARNIRGTRSDYLGGCTSTILHHFWIASAVFRLPFFITSTNMTKSRSSLNSCEKESQRRYLTIFNSYRGTRFGPIVWPTRKILDIPTESQKKSLNKLSCKLYRGFPFVMVSPFSCFPFASARFFFWAQLHWSPPEVSLSHPRFPRAQCAASPWTSSVPWLP